MEIGLVTGMVIVIEKAIATVRALVIVVAIEIALVYQ